MSFFGASYPCIKCNNKSYPTDTEAICTEKETNFTCIGEICIKQWYNLYVLLCRVVWLYCNCFMTKKLEGKTGHHDELVLQNY